MKPVTVTQLNEYIAQKLRGDARLHQLPVEGEISSINMSGRTRYLTLKDTGSLVKCVIWDSNSKAIDPELLTIGTKIIAIGDISPYPKGGYYSFSITSIEAAGEGALMAEFNRIRKLLEDEGLFDKRWKKPIPEFPRRIGIITSDTGAAIEDIKKIITSKNNLTDLLIFPTIVQGSLAPASIIKNIELANSLNDGEIQIDTLIVGRGGGSPEDLAAFNDERVARAIFASKIPIISAVGHESDISISDFVADLRAETPTAAADIAVMNTYELHDRIQELKGLLVQILNNKIQSERSVLDSRRELIISNIKMRLVQARSRIEKTMVLLEENHPDKVISKGYAVIIGSDGKIIQDAYAIDINTNYEIKMRDGSLIANIISRNIDNDKLSK